MKDNDADRMQESFQEIGKMVQGIRRVRSTPVAQKSEQEKMTEEEQMKSKERKPIKLVQQGNERITKMRLQAIATPLAIPIVGYFNYRLVDRGLDQVRDASRERREQEDRRHREAMGSLRPNDSSLRELIERTGVTSRPA